MSEFMRVQAYEKPIVRPILGKEGAKATLKYFDAIFENLCHYNFLKLI